jgi:hypothetical protein
MCSEIECGQDALLVSTGPTSEGIWSGDVVLVKPQL